MILSDYVMDFLVSNNIRDIFHISGGGIMYLGDSLGKRTDLNYICNHHEQAVSMAVEGYSRINGFGVGLITTGPAVTNALTGVAGAWMDSTPCMIISGQVNTNEMMGASGLRQLGIQEINTIPLVSTITKYAYTIKDPKTVRYYLEKAKHYAISGRPGPVWIEIPLDVQGANINENSEQVNLEKLVSESIKILREAQRPVIYGGRGIDLAGARDEFKELLNKINAPTVVSWNGADLIEENHPVYIGRPGLFGQRAANFTVQNSDAFLCIGARLSIPQIGYNFKSFAREAKRIIVDIDEAELKKKTIEPTLPIKANAKDYLQKINQQLGNEKLYWTEWLDRCKSWKEQYPTVNPDLIKQKDFISSYIFLDKLSNILTDSDVIVTDMGSSFTCTFQSFKIKKGQRLFTSSGLASMGFGLPGAIGACVANNKKRTICLTGDGGLQFNIQELQTLKHYNLPIKVFVFDNKGYNAIASMQDKNFSGRYTGSENNSGVSTPDFEKIAQAYGIEAISVYNHFGLEDKIRQVVTSQGPMLCNLKMDLREVLQPRVVSQLGCDGKWCPSPLEDMSPFLPNDEFNKNMIIKTLR